MTTPDYDDERTVIKGALAGPHDALRAGLPGEYADALPAGTHLHEFEFSRSSARAVLASSIWRMS